MTEADEKAALALLVAPWLPGASVDSLYIQESCGCYSEWTTDSPDYHVTFAAPRPVGESDRALSDVVRVIEGPVMQFALRNHTFHGCSCCCGNGESDDYDDSNIRPSLWVRIIPLRDAVDPHLRSEGKPPMREKGSN